MTFHFSNKICIFLKHNTKSRKDINGKVCTGFTLKITSIGAAFKLKYWRLTSNKPGTAQVAVVSKAPK